MAYFDDKHVLTGNVVLTWNGINTPETRQSGSTNWNVGTIINPASAEFAELNALAMKALNESPFNGVLPANGKLPLTTQADPAKFGPEYNGWLVLNAGNSNGAPPVYDANGNQLDAMQYSSQLYPGCIVQLLLHAFAYDNVNKGVSLGLDGIKIIDSSAPKLPVATGMSSGEVASAFGGGGVSPATPPAAPGLGMATPPAAPAAPGLGMATPPAAPAPTVPQMTAAAQGTYEAYIAAGWSDDQLRQNGLIV